MYNADQMPIELKERLSVSVQKWLDSNRPYFYLKENRTSLKFMQSKGFRPWMYERIIQHCNELVR